MDPELAEEMSSNEALRRILKLSRETNEIITDPDGLKTKTTSFAEERPNDILVSRVAAGNPAVLIAQPNPERKGGVLRNLDTDQPGYYGSQPGVNAATGATLNPGESIPLNFAGAIYIFSSSNAPMFEWMETI